MADENEITVTVEPELPLGDTVTIEKKPEPTTEAVEDFKSQLADLQGQVTKSQAERDNERSRREAAEQAAIRAAQEVYAARSEAADSQLGTVETGLSAAQTEREAAKNAYKSAMEAGNWDAAAEAQERIATAAAHIMRLSEAKYDIETRQPVEQHRQQIEQPRQHVDPVEAYIANRTAPTQKWLREHRDWVVDPKKNAKLTAAHWNAIGENLQPDTDEYFSAVETFIGVKPAPKPRRSGAPVAPVNGGSTSVDGTSTNEVRLTAGEARAAQDGSIVWNWDDPQKKFRKGDPIGIQEFARRKREMMRQGLYDKSYSEQ